MENNRWICPDEAATEALAARLAARAAKGDVFALVGTLGIGKSVFARAFIKALCRVSEVPSPTFTLVQEYSAPQFTIFHYDLYRLKSPEEIFELGMEEAMYDGVCLIEWPERMGGYLPRKCVTVTLTPADNGRIISIDSNDKSRLERLLG